MAENSGNSDHKNEGRKKSGNFDRMNSGGENRGKGNRSGGRRRNNRRRGNKQRGRRYLSSDVVYVCPVCGQNVRDVLTAIAFGEEKSPAHFDCVVKKIAGTEELRGKEKIVYLGKGEFGVVKFKGGGNKFEIIRRIPLENEREGTITWRKEISKHLRK